MEPPGARDYSRHFPGQRPVIRSDGCYVRDYFYIEDAAAAYMLLAEKLAATPELRGQAFNFAHDTTMTVLALVQEILKHMDSLLRPVILNEARSEILYQSLDATKAQRLLAWRPQFSLAEGLRRTISWYREFLGGSQPFLHAMTGS